jgi:hypothetical protein
MTDTALRWNGLLLMGGAILLGAVIVRISFNPVVNQQFTSGISLFMLLASIMLLLSLPGMYARQANAAGWLGLVGYMLLQSGTVLMVVLASTPLLYPSLKEAPGENPAVFGLGIAFTLGLLLTSIATLRAGVFPRGAGILLLVAMAGFFFDFFVAEFLPAMAGQVGSAFFAILLALALAWIGLSLWNGPLQSSG